MPIPLLNVVMFGVALILTTIVPILVLMILCLKKKINWLPMIVGAGAFFVSQIILRIPILNALGTQEWFQSFANNNFIVYVVVIGGFTAGLFEESARLGGVKLLKQRTTYKDAISFGLGHAICEVIMLNGMTNVNNVLYSLMINTGNTELLGANLQPITNALVGASPLMIGLGLFERLTAITFHVFATLLIFKGANERKISYYLFAILAHTIVNSAAVLVSQYVNPIASEVTLGVLAAAMLICIIKAKTSFKSKQNSVMR